MAGLAMLLLQRCDTYLTWCLKYTNVEPIILPGAVRENIDRVPADADAYRTARFYGITAMGQDIWWHYARPSDQGRLRCNVRLLHFRKCLRAFLILQFLSLLSTIERRNLIIVKWR